MPGLEDRPGLAAALTALRSVGAGVLAVARRDRLARDVALAAAIDRAVEHAGAKVRSADGAGDGDGPADRLLRGMLDLTAEYERALIRTRTRAASKRNGPVANAQGSALRIHRGQHGTP